MVLHQHSHHHHHGHGNKQHGATMVGVPREVESVGGAIDTNVRVKKHTNINVRAAFIHVIGDLFQSIGVVAAAYIIRFKVLSFTLFLMLL